MAASCDGAVREGRSGDGLMDETQWLDVMTLLAVMVVVDGKVFKEEVDTFIEEAIKLSELVGLEASFSKKLAFDWYVTRRTDIKKICAISEPSAQVIALIKALKESPHRFAVLASMNKIALADQNFHPAEFNTLSLAGKEWN